MARQLILLSVFLSLACGMTAPVAGTVDTAIEAEASTDVKMVVTGSLNIRTDHTEKSDDIGDLFAGNFVTCTEFYIGKDAGDGIWCKHEQGWSNARWMRAVEEKEGR